MREIKFRAWDLISKKMVQVIHFYNHNDVYPDYIFMQYTGLKDANGKEIYEGDVVADQYGYRFEIVFRDGCWFAGNSEVGFSPKNTFEVIGNIYENPELLERIIK